MRLQPLGEEQMAELLASLASLRVTSSSARSADASTGRRSVARKTPARSARKPAPVESSSSEESEVSVCDLCCTSAGYLTTLSGVPCLWS